MGAQVSIVGGQRLITASKKKSKRLPWTIYIIHIIVSEVTFKELIWFQAACMGFGDLELRR